MAGSIVPATAPSVRPIRLLLPILAVLLVAFSLGGTALGWMALPAAMENRRLADFPPPRPDAGWFAAFDRFALDRTATRRLLTAAYAGLRYELFASTATRSVLVGEGGLLFSRAIALTTAYEAPDRPCGFQRALARQLREQRAWLTERGLPGLLVIAPTKEDMFLDRTGLDPAGWRFPRAHRTRLIEHEAAAALGPDFVPIYDRLRATPDGGFRRYDTHWTTAGAALAVTAALDAARARGVLAEALHWGAGRRPERGEVGNLGRLMGLPLVDHDLRPEAEGPERNLQLSRTLGSLALPQPGYVFTNPQLPPGRVMVIGDSFTGAFCAALARLVRESVCLNVFAPAPGTAPDRFPITLIDAVAPDLLITVLHANKFENVLENITDPPNPAPVRAALSPEPARSSPACTP